MKDDDDDGDDEGMARREMRGWRTGMWLAALEIGGKLN